MSEAVENFLKELGDELQKEADNKVTLAMRTWMQCDDNYKLLVLKLTGFDFRLFSSPDLVRHMRDHFDTMDLLDELDGCIEEMQWDIDQRKKEALDAKGQVEP